MVDVNLPLGVSKWTIIVVDISLTSTRHVWKVDRSIKIDQLKTPGVDDNGGDDNNNYNNDDDGGVDDDNNIDGDYGDGDGDDGDTSDGDVLKGVKQGDILSAILFAWS